MFDSILGFCDQLSSVIALVVMSTVVTHVWWRTSTKKSKETFIGLLLILMVGAQLYHLIFAAVYIPTNPFFDFNVSF